MTWFLSFKYVTPVDEAGLALLCQEFARWRQAEQDISKNGVLLRTGKLKITAKRTMLPRVRLNPATRYSDVTAKLIKSLLVQFGLTPRARGLVKISFEEDELAQFLRGE
jgi:P27 family predicted phage terminase small subunit